jgi:hypothetical protein
MLKKELREVIGGKRRGAEGLGKSKEKWKEE